MELKAVHIEATVETQRNMHIGQLACLLAPLIWFRTPFLGNGDTHGVPTLLPSSVNNPTGLYLII